MGELHIRPQTGFVRAPKTNIILPLYIYPLPGAWDPLYAALAQYADVNFTIIINPHDGPGKPNMPDEEYSAEIKKLNAMPNVMTVGYVRVDWCRRPIQDVLSDIAKYAGWSTDYSRTGLAVHGIFFDESPNEHSEHAVAFMKQIDGVVKSAAGILGERLTIHNPGTVPDHTYSQPGPDVTAVVEESYKNYRTNPWLRKKLDTLTYPRSRCSYMVHSVPPSEVVPLVHELRHLGDYVFVTESRENYYEKFGVGWMRFVDAMR